MIIRVIEDTNPFPAQEIPVILRSLVNPLLPQTSVTSSDVYITFYFADGTSELVSGADYTWVEKGDGLYHIVLTPAKATAMLTRARTGPFQVHVAYPPV